MKAAETMTLPNELLFGWVKEEIAAGHTVRFKVRGVSMRPWMPEGTEVLLQPCRDEDLRPGEVVLFRDRSRYVLHRIVRREGERLVLQGDAVVALYEQCTVADAVGKVVEAVRPSGRRLRMQSRWLRLAFRLWRMLGRQRGKALRIWGWLEPSCG
jgi:hypothetical protein